MLGQRMDLIENGRLKDDDQYIKNIKLDVSNFNGRLNPQYYKKGNESSDISSGMRHSKSGEFALLQ